ncbi:hypothetical protein AAHE18_09G091000 [Arachis hypogaea]
MDVEFDWLPKLGKTFNTVEEAWQFWIDYGGRMGFGVRKQYSNKNADGKILSLRFVCAKEGVRKSDKRDSLTVIPRLETRTNCGVKLGIRYIKGIEKYEIHDFFSEHNHPLHLSHTTHMLTCQRKISQVQAQEIEMADDSGITQRASFELMSRQVGGRENIGYTRLDQKNYLRTKRMKSMAYGEAGSLLAYFQQESLENPSFSHAIQLDLEEQITNIFWADAKMIMDYEYFGDVVTLDTTYSTNNACRPLAVFAGFNHFRGVVIFGAALLYDESSDSFEWLFRVFLKTHKNKKPRTIFTDQAAAMANGLAKVMPETYHALCSWHLMQNGIKHLGNLMKNGSYFLQDFKACMYEYVDETNFKEAWDKLLDDYDLKENKWLMNLYKLKEKWARCYMNNAFTIGMRSTQLSESLNADLKNCMKPNLNIIQFFNHFERVVNDKRYNELQGEFQSRQKLPRLKMVSSPLLQQVSEVYTLPLFNLFQEEYDKYSAACIREVNDRGFVYEYVVALCNENKEFKVTFDPSLSSISCNCRKFETFGILCCHAIKVLDVKDIKLLPEQYILKRWTRGAMRRLVKDMHGRIVEEDTCLTSTQWFKQTCPKLVRTVTQASDCKEARVFVEKAVEELSKKVDDICKLNLGLEINDTDSSLPIQCTNLQLLEVRGLRRRNGVRNFRRRPKSWVEKQPKNKKNQFSNTSQQQKQDKVIKLNGSISQLDEHGFNRLLMEPLDVFLQPNTFVNHQESL